MIALAALLLIAAVALVVWVIMGLNGNNANTVHFNALGVDTDIKPLTLFALGALALLLVWAATRLFAAGTKRKYRQHKETRELKKEHKEHERAQEAREREINRHGDRGTVGHRDEAVVDRERTDVVEPRREDELHRDGELRDGTVADRAVTEDSGRRLDDGATGTGRHYR